MCICEFLPQLGCEVHDSRWFCCISAILCSCALMSVVCGFVAVLRVSTFACRYIPCAMFPAFVSVARLTPLVDPGWVLSCHVLISALELPGYQV